MKFVLRVMGGRGRQRCFFELSRHPKLGLHTTLPNNAWNTVGGLREAWSALT
jgi:hypothetical protein